MTEDLRNQTGAELAPDAAAAPAQDAPAALAAGVDRPRIEAAVRELLVGIGKDPDRPGLVGTPDRVARACEELFSGLADDPARHLSKQLHEEDNEELVVVSDIPFHSMCEHHILPFIGRAHVAYIPRGRPDHGPLEERPLCGGLRRPSPASGASYRPGR